MPKTTEIKFREEMQIKRKAAACFKAMGLDTSSALRLFLREVVRTGRLPLILESGFTPEGERAILETDRQITEETQSGRAKSYPNAQALLAQLDEE